MGLEHLERSASETTAAITTARTTHLICYSRENTPGTQFVE